METMNQTITGLDVNVDPLAEEAVVTLIASMFSDIAIMSPETVRKNIELACEGGMSEKDRSIRAELANYVINHFAYIIMGMVANEEFRGMIFDAVLTEIGLDGEPQDFIDEIRRDMSRDIRPSKPSKGKYVIDLSGYDDKLFKAISDRFSRSLEKMAQFDDEMSECVDGLTDEEREQIGFCISNFMFAFRALSQNPLFASCLKGTIRAVEETVDKYF